MLSKASKCIYSLSSRLFSTSNRIKTNTRKSRSVDDHKRLIVAYGLSEELQLDNTRNLIGSLKQYSVVKLPKDLQDEVVMITQKSIRQQQTSNLFKEDVNNSDSLQDILIFREGSIVFWGIEAQEQKRFLNALIPMRKEPFSKELIDDEKEHFEFEFISGKKSRFSKGIINIAKDKDNVEQKLDQFACSHAIVQSVRLAIREAVLDDYINSVSWITEHMKTGKTIKLSRDQVFKKTGELYELKHNINLSSDLLDVPDAYWDRHEQELLFSSLIHNLNIKRRTEVINEKLNNCCELMSLLSNHMNDKHHVRLEWMIIVLIMVEVLFEFRHFIA